MLFVNNVNANVCFFKSAQLFCIFQYEELDKQSAESTKKKVKSGEGSKPFDETTDEELKEVAKTVDVKTRIQLSLESQETPNKTLKQNADLEDEELKAINLKERLEVFNKEADKHAADEDKVMCALIDRMDRLARLGQFTGLSRFYFETGCFWFSFYENWKT